MILFLIYDILGCFVKNYRYDGYNLKELSGKYIQSSGKVLESAEDCQKFCQKYEECEVFTYFTESKKCFIKSQAGKKEAAKAISGPKYCKGTHTYPKMYVYDGIRDYFIF